MHEAPGGHIRSLPTRLNSWTNWIKTLKDAERERKWRFRELHAACSRKVMEIVDFWIAAGWPMYFVHAHAIAHDSTGAGIQRWKPSLFISIQSLFSSGSIYWGGPERSDDFARFVRNSAETLQTSNGQCSAVAKNETIRRSERNPKGMANGPSDRDKMWKESALTKLTMMCSNVFQCVIRVIRTWRDLSIEEDHWKMAWQWAQQGCDVHSGAQLILLQVMAEAPVKVLVNACHILF